MADGAAKVAQALTQDHAGFSAGRLELWGIALVRPNDLNYELTSAQAKGDTLTLTFHDGSTLVLEGAEGLSAAKKTLAIASARKGTWTEAGSPPLTAELQGKQLWVTTRSGREPRALPKSPALFLA